MDDFLFFISTFIDYLGYLCGFIKAFFVVAFTYITSNPLIFVLVLLLALKLIKIVKDVIL